jgi:uncharacterized protein (TIGR03437 family)
MRSVLLLVAFSGISFSQPYINYRGIVNVASYMAPGLPAGSLPRGGMIAIFGRNLGPATGAQATNFPLDTTLAGVSVTVTQQSTTVNALPVYVGAGQINAIIPSGAPLGRVSIRATVNGVASNPCTVNIVAANVGLFSVNSGGFGPGIIQNFSADGIVVNSTQLTARPGQVEILWGTGLGAVAADNVAPTPGDLPIQVEVFLGGQSAAVLYSGRTSCCAGIDQINFTVPSGAPAGCYVPVVVRLNGSLVSNTVTMAIDPNGAPCTDPANPLSAIFRSGGRFGAALLSHEDVHSATAVSGSATFDSAALSLRQETGGAWAFDPYVSLPPVGTCTAYAIAGVYPGLNDLPGITASVKDLDGGASASIAGTAGTASLPRGTTSPMFYSALLATSLGLSGVPTSFFSDGSPVVLSGAGGPDVGSFQAKVTAGPAFTWTNQGSVTAVTRSAGFAVTWSNAPPGTTAVSIVGFNADLANNVSGGFLCLASPSAGTFTVPPLALGNLPATPASSASDLGWISVGAALLGSPASFAATGLDQGIAVFASSSRQSVVYR